MRRSKKEQKRLRRLRVVNKIRIYQKSFAEMFYPTIVITAEEIEAAIKAHPGTKVSVCEPRINFSGMFL
jgi:hypothetical protein